MLGKIGPNKHNLSYFSLMVFRPYLFSFKGINYIQRLSVYILNYKAFKVSNKRLNFACTKFHLMNGTDIIITNIGYIIC